jgi:hypothetical protein
MAKDGFFIEKRAQGDFAIRKANSKRASAVADIQAKAVIRAKQLNPEAAIHVERVRNVGPGPDKWRKL